jgi:predicted adenine nucleotide alpha hydrolase (AANH) superfamily ATPase
MNLLFHICCGPCATAPVQGLLQAGHQVTGFFYNPNIHPYVEFNKRLEAVRQYAGQAALPVIYHDEYDLRGFLRRVLFREDERCRFCYFMRFHRTAVVAKNGSFDAFTSTLLASPHQDHELIRSIAGQVSAEVGIPFHYQDFRETYKESYDLSKRYDLYRQSYCGCIFSEYERYAGKKNRRRKPIEKSAG